MKKYKPVKGTARRYLNPRTGQEISRRQYDKLRAAKGLIKKKSAVSVAIQRKKSKTYNDLLTSYIDKQKQKGRKLTRKAARESDTMKRIVQDLKSSDPKRKLRALKKTTRRDGISDDILVGESPKAGISE